MQEKDIVIAVTKDEIRVNGILCTDENYQEVMGNAGIEREEAICIMKTIFSSIGKEASAKLIRKSVAPPRLRKLF